MYQHLSVELVTNFSLSVIALDAPSPHNPRSVLRYGQSAESLGAGLLPHFSICFTASTATHQLSPFPALNSPPFQHSPPAMQIYVLASIALAAVSAVQAKDVNGSSVNSTSSGSGAYENAEAGVGSVVTYTTLVGDWEACTEDVGCESSTSVCVRHSGTTRSASLLCCPRATCAASRTAPMTGCTTTAPRTRSATRRARTSVA